MSELQLETDRADSSPLWASQVAQVVKNLPANAGDIRDVGSVPRSRRFFYFKFVQNLPLSTKDSYLNFPQLSQTKHSENRTHISWENFVLKKKINLPHPPILTTLKSFLTSLFSQTCSSHHQALSTLCICLLWFLCFPPLSPPTLISWTLYSFHHQPLP